MIITARPNVAILPSGVLLLSMNWLFCLVPKHDGCGNSFLTAYTDIVYSSTKYDTSYRLQFYAAGHRRRLVSCNDASYSCHEIAINVFVRRVITHTTANKGTTSLLRKNKNHFQLPCCDYKQCNNKSTFFSYIRKHVFWYMWYLYLYIKYTLYICVYVWYDMWFDHCWRHYPTNRYNFFRLHFSFLLKIRLWLK